VCSAAALRLVVVVVVFANSFAFPTARVTDPSFSSFSSFVCLRTRTAAATTAQQQQP